jgi:hypothetical protein
MLSLCYTARTVNNDDKILKILADLQVGQKALQADVQKQGEYHLEPLTADSDDTIVLQAAVEGHASHIGVPT